MLPLRRHIFFQVPRFYFRSLASITDAIAPAPYQVFDRYAKVLQRDRSAVSSRVQNSRTVDYLRDEVADRLVERMLVSIYPLVFPRLPQRVACRISSESSAPYLIWVPVQATSRSCWRSIRRVKSSCLIRVVCLSVFVVMHLLLRGV